MMELWNDISGWSVLKWVVIVLVAGFIGQFGKTLAQAVLARMRRSRSGKSDQQGIEPAAGKTERIPPSADVTSQANGPVGIPNKKASKILAKQQKKSEKQSQKGPSDR